MERIRVRVTAAAVTLTALAALAATAPGAFAATPDPAPYGANDAGGFLNVLPPGEAGVANVLDLAAFEATGKFPAHFDDQQPLYENLVYADPALADSQVPNYFKDATFGVKA